MTDWTKQTQDMLTTWTDTQKKMWDSWLESMQQTPGQIKTQEMWQQTIDTWEKTVSNTMATQTEWLKIWTDNFTAQKGMPEEVTKWAEQTQEMMEQWSETQKQLWEGWFELVKNVDFAKMSETLDEDGKKALETWQEAVEKVIANQEQWMKMWTAGKTQQQSE